jgi:hypothetical protein
MTYFYLECKFVINKISLIIFINTSFYEKIQDSSINSTKYDDLSY